MAGKIIADTIETGAGADISTSYVVNGSAKAWVTFDGIADTVDESFGVSSISDNATGRFHANLQNAFTSSRYPYNVSSNYSRANTVIDTGYLTSSQAAIAIRNDASTWLDSDVCVISAQGDLA